ncbi:MAG: NAD(P)-dependent glycerol-3-phosphate dehydrogenase [Bosea sp.]|jgi:glycerol-3-phosphate dehydrogenase (NAD(P)+)|nr:NAD(P)-dependent glycerol-3-phosphate dehydrogenase [Bosea sp. (in: a-proteobacteria)]
MTLFQSIAVVGAGAWGTALANAAARAGRDVTLIARDPDHAAEMAAERENRRRLPGVRLEAAVTPTCDLARSGTARAVLLVTPAQSCATMAEALALVLKPGVPVVLCAKGIDRARRLFLGDIIADALPRQPFGVLSGPSFAEDVSRGLPTAVVLASADAIIAEALAMALSGSTFRVYHGQDVRGVEIGGAAKNVLAIACGAVMGRGLGESARAALLARGFAELTRFARAYGGEASTLMGLSGLGDLVLTGSSPRSRNYAFGEALGRGLPPSQASGGKLAEGALTAAALLDLAEARGVDMPISREVTRLVAGEAGLDEAIAALMARPTKAEA